MRTNIVLNEKLVQQAMKLSGIKTKKDVVEESLKLFVMLKQQAALRDAFGKLKSWDGDIDAMRRDA